MSYGTSGLNGDALTLFNCDLINNTGGYGGGAMGGTLINCRLIGNVALIEGGGLCGGLGGGFATNCTLTGNSAPTGGGASGSQLYNCTLISNIAADSGGGANGCNLNNCTLIENSAAAGGGANNGTLDNCIVYYNSALIGPDYNGSTLNYCCTTTWPINGINNITNAPLFVNMITGNLRLQTNSPCINGGNNPYVNSSTDLDGRPRIVSGSVDIGAYEFQGAGIGEFIAWLQEYGLPTDGSADNADSDGDGMKNWQEWKAGTNPNDASSVLKLSSVVYTNSSAGVIVTWQSVSNATYYLQRSSNLAAQQAFSNIQSNIVGQAGTTSFTDTTATNGTSFFYRVGVQ